MTMLPITRAWAILTVLTVLSLVVALAGGGGEAMGAWGNAVALGAAFVKACQVLDHFLGLRKAGAGWRNGFAAGLIVLLAGIGLIGVAGSFAQSPPSMRAGVGAPK